MPVIRGESWLKTLRTWILSNFTHLPPYPLSAYIERTPYEISMPSYGISVKTVNEGSTWNNGFLVKAYPEFPIHFTIGMTGCAFSILLNSYLAGGGELDKDFVKFVGMFGL